MQPNVVIIVAVATLAGCSGARSDSTRKDSVVTGRLDSARPIASVSGFTQPEAVRYDPDQDIYFVGNWGPGGPGAIDNNGFISRMSADGKIAQLKFIAGGTRGAVLNAPRGMIIVGDTLWVVDADAIRGFNRRTGAPLATVSFSAFKLGFLNDIAGGPDGLYVTDTGTEEVYRIAGGRVTVSLQDASLGGPNGITWDASGHRFIIVPYNGDSVIRAWTPGSNALTVVGRSDGSSFDGVEVLGNDSVLVATQSDSSLYLFTGGRGRPVIRTGGAPADIAIDTKRHRVAAPFVSRSLVEIWALR
jgi:sugar lactone lactonase YvrE